MTAAEVAKFGVGSNDLTLFVHGKTAEKVRGSKREQSCRASARKGKQLEILSSGVTRAQARDQKSVNQATASVDAEKSVELTVTDEMSDNPSDVLSHMGSQYKDHAEL